MSQDEKRDEDRKRKAEEDRRREEQEQRKRDEDAAMAALIAMMGSV